MSSSSGKLDFQLNEPSSLGRRIGGKECVYFLMISSDSLLSPLWSGKKSGGGRRQGRREEEAKASKEKTIYSIVVIYGEEDDATVACRDCQRRDSRIIKSNRNATERQQSSYSCDI
jgi:hypothetical protein